MTWDQIQPVLDQLFFSQLLPQETVETRAETIEVFLSSNGWSWDKILDYLVMEDTILA
jgi:hypothetical protein